MTPARPGALLASKSPHDDEHRPSQIAKVCGRGGWEYVMIDGPETHEVTQNPDRPSCERHRRELEHSDGEWQRECAMEAGMLHGVEAYNDEMGY